MIAPEDADLPAVLEVDDVPDGLTAVPVWRTSRAEDGTRSVVRGRSRAQAPRLNSVDLKAATGPNDMHVEDEWWLLAASRRPAGLRARFGDRWWAAAVEAARAGCVALRCEISGPPWTLGPLRRTMLTPAAVNLRDQGQSQREQRGAALRARAAVIFDSLRGLSQPLAEALQAARPGTTRFSVLLAAAEDLIGGVVHAGARAFSQAHLGGTKQADVVAILRSAGATEDVLRRLGVATSDMVGVGGAAWLVLGEDVATTRGFAGVTQVRVPQPGLRLRHHPSTRLIVVENRHAATWLADHCSRQFGVVWVTGMPSDAAVALLADAGGLVIVVPDADLGGALIADRLLTAMPDAVLLDVGPYAAVGDGWSDRQRAQLTQLAAREDAVGRFALACLHRGGPVEQEQTMPRVAHHIGVHGAWCCPA